MMTNDVVYEQCGRNGYCKICGSTCGEQHHSDCLFISTKNKIKVIIEGKQYIKAKRTIEIPIEDYKKYLLLLRGQGEPGGGREFWEYCNNLGEDWLDDPMYIYDWDDWDDVEIIEEVEPAASRERSE